MNLEIKQLKERLKELSVSQLASELGYRSPTTIVTWFKNKKVPKTALRRVHEYLKTSNKG